MARVEAPRFLPKIIRLIADESSPGVEHEVSRLTLVRDQGLWRDGADFATSVENLVSRFGQEAEFSWWEMPSHIRSIARTPIVEVRTKGNSDVYLTIAKYISTMGPELGFDPRLYCVEVTVIGGGGKVRPHPIFGVKYVAEDLAFVYDNFDPGLTPGNALKRGFRLLDLVEKGLLT